MALLFVTLGDFFSQGLLFSFVDPDDAQISGKGRRCRVLERFSRKGGKVVVTGGVVEMARQNESNSLLIFQHS